MADKKLVLHVVQSLNFGGVETHMKVIGGSSGFSKYEHSFCAISRGGAIATEMIEEGTDVSILECNSKIPSFSAIMSLVRHFRSVKPEIVHCHGAEANFHGIIAGRICGIKVCLGEEIGFPNHSRRARFVFRNIYRISDGVVAISEAVRLKLIELGEVSSKKIHVLLNPALFLRRNTAAEVIDSSDSVKVGFVGRLEEVKNPVALVHAAGILRNRGYNLHVTIVGDGSQRQWLEDEVTRLNLAEVVSLVGFKDDPSLYISDVDIYVQPSISEGFGLALVEAMSLGIPSLASAVGGAPEIISDGVNGWLLRGTSALMVADGLERLIEVNVDTRRNVGEIGRASVLERFSPKAYFLTCDKLYDKLLKSDA